MPERLTVADRINKEGVKLTALTPVLTGILTVASVVHEGNRRFAAEQAFCIVKENGYVPNFLRWTGWLLSRVGQKEVEQAIEQGKKVRALNEYLLDIPPVFWDTIDRLDI